MKKKVYREKYYGNSVTNKTTEKENVVKLTNTTKKKSDKKCGK